MQSTLMPRNALSTGQLRVFMNDMSKSKRKLVEELEELRRRISELEASSSGMATGLSQQEPLAVHGEATESEQPDTGSLHGEPLMAEIARRERTESALRESEQQFRVLIENSLTGVCLQQDEVLVYVNDRFAEIFGYHPVEIIRRPLWEIVAPEYVQLIKQRGRQRLRGESPISQYEIRILTKESEERFLAVWFSIVEHKGRPAILGNVVDITDMKRVETALKESEKRFRTVFETAPDCIFIKDRNLRYTHVNPAMVELFGWQESDLIGRSDADLYGSRVASQLRRIDSRVLRGESVETEHTRSVNGVPITFDDIKVPMRNSAGDITGLFGISRNVTERKRRTSRQIAPNAGSSTSPAMRSAVATAGMAAEKDGMVLLLGESGVGKDYMARYIHDRSPRRNGPYFAVNCAALPPELAESELFGHEPGAFTGAAARKRGLLELAEGGTLLLNEIGDLSLSLQAKLLTFLDTRSFTRVGGEKAIRVSARIIAATNKDLENEVREGRFRQDLYYRINVLSIRVPPLRERKEDIPGLVRVIFSQLLEEMQLSETPMVDEKSLDMLREYKWPGNVRELRNVLERGLMLWDGGPFDLSVTHEEGTREGIDFTVRLPLDRTLYDVTDEIARKLLMAALTHTGGNKRRAARLLGISRNSLYRYMKRVAI